VFKHGETEVTKTITLLPPTKNLETKEGDGENAGGDGEEEEEAPDLMFRVTLEKPEPDVVKLSRKNVAFVTITQGDDEEEEG